MSNSAKQKSPISRLGCMGVAMFQTRISGATGCDRFYPLRQSGKRPPRRLAPKCPKCARCTGQRRRYSPFTIALIELSDESNHCFGSPPKNRALRECADSAY